MSAKVSRGPKDCEPTLALTLSSSSSTSNLKNSWKKKIEDVDRKRLDGKTSVRTVSVIRMKAMAGATSPLGHHDRSSRKAVLSDTSFVSEDDGGGVVLLADIPVVSDDTSPSSSSSSTNTNSNNFFRREKHGTYHVDFTGKVTLSGVQRLDEIEVVGRPSILKSSENALEQAEGGMPTDSIGEGHDGQSFQKPSTVGKKMDCADPKSVNCCGMAFYSIYRLAMFVTLWILSLATASVVVGLLIRHLT